MERSRRLAASLVAAHIASLVVIWPLALPINLHIGLKLAVLASLLWSLGRAGWLGARTHPFRLRLPPHGKAEAADRIEIEFPWGRTVRGTLVEGSFVLSGLVILRCREDGARWWRPDRSWILLPDSVPPDAHRQLRVRLRWGRAAPV
ncbi:MAG: hypothetical protein JNM76_02150 [Betaproteobacteria bacterium]|nr:hypothetical protein [Betaproteobacteria bacterium]